MLSLLQPWLYHWRDLHWPNPSPTIYAVCFSLAVLFSSSGRCGKWWTVLPRPLTAMCQFLLGYIHSCDNLQAYVSHSLHITPFPITVTHFFHETFYYQPFLVWTTLSIYSASLSFLYMNGSVSFTGESLKFNYG